jgi:guanylate kinase
VAANGTLYVLSSPSGGGKGSILSAVFERDPLLKRSISATTRRPRDGEQEGQHYRFIDGAKFDAWVDEDKFVEWAQVHNHRYGTLREELDALLDTGCDVVLELDVQGMRSLKKQRDDVVSIFVEPPSFEELERRLHARGGLTDEDLAIRMRTAREEMTHKEAYDHVIMNDVLGDAIADFEGILRETRRIHESKASMP